MAAGAPGRTGWTHAHSLLTAAFFLSLPLEISSTWLPAPLDLSRLVLGAAAVLLIVDWARRRRGPWVPLTGGTVLIGVYAVASAASYLVARPPGAGLALLPVLLYPIAMVIVANLADSPRARAAAVSALLASALVLAALSLGLYFTGHSLWRAVAGVHRVNATMGDPDILARFLCLGALAGTFVAVRPGLGPRYLGLAAAVASAMALPTTLSRFGLVLLPISLLLAAVPRGTRVKAVAVAALALTAAAGLTAARPDLRERSANLVGVFGSVLHSATKPPPPEQPWGDSEPYQRVKACEVYGGWSDAYDPTALHGRAARLPRGADRYSFAFFGRPAVLPSGSYVLWMRIRALDPRSRAPELHLGMWDRTDNVFLPGSYIDSNPSGFSPYFGWFQVGAFTAPGNHPLEARIQSLVPATTDWYVDQFAVTAPGGRPPPPRPWGASAPEALALPRTVQGGFTLERERAGSRTATAAQHRAFAPDGGADFATAQPVPAGTYQVWLEGRVTDVSAADSWISSTVLDSAGRPALDLGTFAPSTLCSSTSAIQVGYVTLAQPSRVTLRAATAGPDRAGWVLGDYALVAAPAGALPMHPVAAVQEPGWQAAIDHLPLDDQRRYLVKAGIQMFLDHPLFGVGYGGFRRAMETDYRGFIGSGYHDVLSHASLVTVAAEQGGLGLLIVGLLLWTLVRNLRSAVLHATSPDLVRLIGLLLVPILLDSQLEGRLFSEPYAWALLGLAWAAAREVRKPAAGPSVAILTHYYPPEVGAPQARLHELATRLAARGVDVSVVTGYPNYPTGRLHPGYRQRPVWEETIEGVRVIRTWVFPSPNRGMVRRLLNHASFSMSSLLAASRIARADVLFVESPPLFLGISARLLSAALRIPYVFNVSDIWPRSAVELGMLRNPLLVRMAEALETWLYSGAAAVSVVTPGILDSLAERGVPKEKLFLLTNGVDTDVYVPAAPDVRLREGLGLPDSGVVLYAGTHGLAQGLGVLLDAAAVAGPGLTFVLVGEGAEKAALEERARRAGLANVRFVPNQPRAVMPGLLSLADVVVVPLKRLDVFRRALPSKMFEAMAVGLPIVLAVWGEAADLVRAADCGIVVEPEDPEALAAAVRRLVEDPQERARLGGNGRRYVQAHFAREAIAERFIELLERTARRRDPV